MGRQGNIRLGLGISVLLLAALVLLLMNFALLQLRRPAQLPGPAQEQEDAGFSLASLEPGAEAQRFCDVYAWSARAAERSVLLEGRLHICDGTEQWIPANDTVQTGQAVLYRYVISCCSGHATPTVLAIEGDAAAWQADCSQDAWVRVQASCQPAPRPGAMPVLRNVQLERLAAAPAEPMEQMYPAGRMGAPCAGTRPDIPYPPR